MDLEKDKEESAKLGMILDFAIEKPRGYTLLYERENGMIGIISARTPLQVVASILRQMADIIENKGVEIQFHGTRVYPNEPLDSANRGERDRSAVCSHGERPDAGKG